MKFGLLVLAVLSIVSCSNHTFEDRNTSDSSDASSSSVELENLRPF